MWQKQKLGQDRPFNKECKMISNSCGKQRTWVVGSHYTLKSNRGRIKMWSERWN